MTTELTPRARILESFDNVTNIGGVPLVKILSLAPGKARTTGAGSAGTILGKA